MLKDTNQMTMDLSPYQGLYEAIIPQDHILRKLKDNIDFSFVNPMLRKQLFGSGVINPKVSGVHDQIQPEKKKPVPLLSANLYTGKCQQPSGKDKQ